MSLFKGTLAGIVGLTVLAVLWRLVVGAVVFTVVLFKILLFVVLPIALVIWLGSKLLKSNGASAGSAGV